MTANFSQTAAYIWSLADLLRGDFKQSQYGRVILPFTILRRLECVLEATKPKVLAQAEKLSSMPALEVEAREKFLIKAAKQSFYNTSAMDLSKMGSADIKSNLLSYVDSFSRDAREIFEHFKFAEFIAQLQDANLLYKVVQKVALTDLSPDAISNHDMGLVFEELIRRFAESSNETAGEHFTPRDIVRLTTSLVFMEDDDALTEPGIIRTIYDPTAGTGGFLSSGMEYVHELNPDAVMRAFGQELNPESYAICKGDMLIKGQDVSRIKLGNTLGDDQLVADRFDYMLSNPPFGVDWKKVEGTIKDEQKLKGFDGRFGPGLPRVSDGSLLFLMHLISKMRDYDPNDPNKNGGRIGIILNGSPLFTGGAGSGESEIRRYILESDLLEAIVALPTDMFYNTGIATYVWILSNKKEKKRRGKVQLINGVHLYQKMRKSLGSKRQEIGEDDVRLVTRTFGNFAAVESYRLDKDDNDNPTRKRGTTSNKKAAKKTFGSKIFESHEFGYRRITIERPLRLSVQFTDERIETLRFASGKLNAAMQTIWERILNQSPGDGPRFYDNLAEPNASALRLMETEIRALVKSDFADLKEKQIKDLLDAKSWTAQKELLDKAIRLQTTIGTAQHDDFIEFEDKLKQAIKDADVELDAKQKKQIIAAVSWTNPDAEPVIKKVISRLGVSPGSKSKGKPVEANPTYGTFEYRDQIVQFQPDSDLRDNEDVPLTADTARGAKVDAVNEAYFNKEVAPHVPDAWIDKGKTDDKDGGVGIVGYEIPFNRHFYEYEPPRPLKEIDAELDELSGEIMQMLQEAHS
ncbi:type I restriction-modification system subunit M [Stieleria sp. TO1_6]|uniref:type I restriction-modification system subunit M n=1 Tax=Stieleria tagensis TaxID=2956795 RepID=UPI00209AB5CA|nr:class I SAM-dependent DNA methyltransferase [Stieleria tagensis]MCO8122872.1 type I restriction-modification system subunit M [Stieleria tagensis]